MSDTTTFDYYYGDESSQFSFYRIPRQLITGEQFKRLSTDAKLLYGLLLDRMGLIDWDEADVWEIIRRWRISPHPCYMAGWNRCSCAMCIFSLPKHWAGIRELFPDWVKAVEEDEQILGFTLDNKMTLGEYIGDAVSCVCHDSPHALLQL